MKGKRARDCFYPLSKLKEDRVGALRSFAREMPDCGALHRTRASGSQRRIIRSNESGECIAVLRDGKTQPTTALRFALAWPTQGQILYCPEPNVEEIMHCDVPA